MNIYLPESSYFYVQSRKYQLNWCLVLLIKYLKIFLFSWMLFNCALKGISLKLSVFASYCNAFADTYSNIGWQNNSRNVACKIKKTLISSHSKPCWYKLTFIHTSMWTNLWVCIECCQTIARCCQPHFNLFYSQHYWCYWTPIVFGWIFSFVSMCLMISLFSSSCV